MIDTSKARWELSKEEKYAIGWLEANGFGGEIEKQNVGSTIFAIVKDGYETKFRLTQGVKNMNIAAYMSAYAATWEMEKRLANA